jgi:hypothetical protein
MGAGLTAAKTSGATVSHFRRIAKGAPGELSRAARLPDVCTRRRRGPTSTAFLERRPRLRLTRRQRGRPRRGRRRHRRGDSRYPPARSETGLVRWKPRVDDHVTALAIEGHSLGAESALLDEPCLTRNSPCLSEEVIGEARRGPPTSSSRLFDSRVQRRHHRRPRIDRSRPRRQPQSPSRSEKVSRARHSGLLLALRLAPPRSAASPPPSRTSP